MSIILSMHQWNKKSLEWVYSIWDEVRLAESYIKQVHFLITDIFLIIAGLILCIDFRSKMICSHHYSSIMLVSDLFWSSSYSEAWFNIKMKSYQYRESHCGVKTILWPSYLHNGIPYAGKMTVVSGLLHIGYPSKAHPRRKSCKISFFHNIPISNYCKTSSINRTKFPNLNVSCFLLQWSLPNPLKPGVKLRMKM